MPPFVIFALPRSRTAWLARFLTYRDCYCGHEELRHLRTVDDIKSWLSLPNTGTAETAAAPWWRTLQKLSPEARVVVVKRPVAEVLKSLANLNLGPFDHDVMRRGLDRLDAKLDQFAVRWPNALKVDYADLGRETTCKEIFEHCLPYPHDHAHWSALSAINIQCNMPHTVRYVNAHWKQLSALGSVLKFQTIADLNKRPVPVKDSVTLQTEPFETFIRDANGLIADHLVKVGERPDAIESKNLDLMQILSDMGCLVVATARSNGRMFGYSMTVLSPSMESPMLKSAIETTFYASDDMPGLGSKLRRFSLQQLRERNLADEVFFRAGPRGSGPRMGAAFRRVGAVHDGELFRLKLGDN